MQVDYITRLLGFQEFYVRVMEIADGIKVWEGKGKVSYLWGYGREAGFFNKHARLTKELFHQAGELCKVMTVEIVATLECLGWEMVKKIGKKACHRI